MSFADFMRLAAAVVYGGVAISAAVMLYRMSLKGVHKAATILLGSNAMFWGLYMTYAFFAFYGNAAHVTITGVTRGVHVYSAAISGLVLYLLATLDAGEAPGTSVLESAIAEAVERVRNG